ncbi:hypothetical protein [Pseudoalteromonas sp. S1727]|uniref:hypothetical protein n=1 Tax=Pseudoalteromonas sp. S1727 TaxID=2066514 RepID=UPI0020165DD3|nr:hypothetical protein [Pseudoalteromonas sp. S1727]
MLEFGVIFQSVTKNLPNKAVYGKRYVFIGLSMKYLWLIPLFLLAGCQTAPTFCEKEPESNLCNQKTYHYNTDQALKEFETKKSKKAFALGQTEDGWEFYGYSESYSSKKKANKRALEECQKRLNKHGSKSKCEVIR